MRAACDDAGIAPGKLKGIGLGSPGTIIDGAQVASAKNLPQWPEEPVTVAERLAAALELEDVPVRIGNDVDVAVWAEFELGAAADYSSLLGVFWGTGVGGGVILDGEQWNGRASAGEIGHMVVEQGGRRCPCGRQGCMEAYAGRAAMEGRARHLHLDEGRDTKLFEIMRDRGRDRLSSGVWYRAAVKHDDALALELLDEAVAAIGTAAASACNLLDPEAVVIGGGMGVRFGEDWVERIRAAMLPHLFRDDEPPAILLAGLGDLGGALGAALLVSR